MKVIKYSEDIEIPVNINSKRVYFPNITRLRGKVINELLVSRSLNAQIFKSPKNKDIVKNNRLKRSFITLTKERLEKKNTIPSLYLNPRNDSYNPPEDFILDERYDVHESFIESSVPYTADDGSVFYFNFHYSDKDSVKGYNRLSKILQTTTIKYETIELKIIESKRQYYFKEQKKLRGKKIIKILTADVSSFPYTPFNNDVVNNAVFSNSYLNLYYDKDIKFRNYPLWHLLSSSSKINKFWLFDLPIVDWEKSFINKGDTTDIVLGEAFIFFVYYID